MVRLEAYTLCMCTKAQVNVVLAAKLIKLRKHVTDIKVVATIMNHHTLAIGNFSSVHGGLSQQVATSSLLPPVRHQCQP